MAWSDVIAGIVACRNAYLQEIDKVGHLYLLAKIRVVTTNKPDVQCEFRGDLGWTEGASLVGTGSNEQKSELVQGIDYI